MERGRLRVYLGAAPGRRQDVRHARRGPPPGRTRHRRGGRLRRDPRPGQDRGRDRRPGGGAPADGRPTAACRPTEMDLAAVLARRPEVALVDELAHTNVVDPRATPATPKRWQDVEILLDAGIDVITTVNIQHLESLNDVVESITGIRQAETVPDAGGPGRRRGRAGGHEPAGPAPADGPRQHLRRRQGRHRAGPLLPGGQPGRAARAGPALAGRPGRRGPGRATARQHGIDGTWATRERVVVGVSGGPRVGGPDAPGRPDRLPHRRRGVAGRLRHPPRRSERGVARPAGASCERGRRGHGRRASTPWSPTTPPTGCWTSPAASTPPRCCIGASRRGRLSTLLRPGVGETVIARVRRHRRARGHPRLRPHAPAGRRRTVDGR